MSNILIGVTGGIAAYKTPIIARLLQKQGHNVKFMMTENATKFIGYVTLEAISKSKVYQPFNEDNFIMSHIELSNWADICIVAPATANTIGKFASGIADSSFLSTLMALKCPLVFAPAMNCNMLEHIAVKENIKKITSWGVSIIEPDIGELACGDTGKGRMADPEIIVERINNILLKKDNNISNGYQDIPKDILNGVNIIVTAGPTKEYIDPVRFITNRSSGKMGYAIAEVAYNMGANVTLITGETSLKSNVKNIIQISTCSDMLDTLSTHINNCDILIMAAAIADYKPKSYSEEKIKKTDDTLTIELTKNIDILKELSKSKKDNQIFVGFAAETENLQSNAIKKLKEKNLDLIVANDVSRNDIGFDSDYNEAKLYFKDGNISETGRKLKTDIAKIIVTESAILLNGLGG